MDTSMDTKTIRSPMMQQWHHCKKEAKDALLLFRLGDFYEAFYEDASTLAQALSLTLTQRQGVPMSGIPVVSLEQHLQTLVKKQQFVVALAEQVEDAKQAKGIVERKIVRTLSPATYSAEPNEHNFLVAIALQKEIFSVSYLDISTGELFATLCDKESLPEELCKCNVTELLISKKNYLSIKELLGTLGAKIHKIEEWYFEPNTAYQRLLKHWQVHNLDGLGLQHKPTLISCIGALFKYVTEDLQEDISHVNTVQYKDTSEFLTFDQVTQEYLGVRSTEPHSMVRLLDFTRTSMGARLLRQWIAYPLCHLEKIHQRQDAVEELLSHYLVPLMQLLDPIRDIERLVIKLQKGRISPPELKALGQSLVPIPKIQGVLQSYKMPLLQHIVSQLTPLVPVVHMLEQALVEQPPTKIGIAIFRKGFCSQLDELRTLKEHSQAYLEKYQIELRQTYDIKTLKVGYNKIFGYYIEVSRGQSHKMPSSFMKKQTLVNAERFISPELKEYEHKILGATEKIEQLEQQYFAELCQRVLEHQKGFLQNAKALAMLDALCSLATVANQANYTKPEVHNKNSINIREGRHPLVEKSLLEEPFVPNNTELQTDSGNMMIITGPNMGGKSTYLRQVALITVLAQVGSFVPAAHASIGMVDSVFSRIGAHDDMARGQSTFMVEMTQTARILRLATSRSLILLDEIGRGTSTYDGVSIAWAVCEYIQNTTRAKTLFATHYLELTELTNGLSGIINAKVAVSEENGAIRFLHTIVQGSGDKSYGIHVAQLAGLPPAAIDFAIQKLHQLSQSKLPSPPLPSSLVQKKAPNLTETLRKKIENLDITNITPLQALEHISCWQDALRSQNIT